MLPSLRLRSLLAVFALLGALLPVSAAPSPVGGGGPPQFEKYFLDDTDFVLVFNVKEIAKAPLFAKNFKKAFDARIGRSYLPPIFKALAIDPLKDVDRVVVLLSRSCHSSTNDTPEGPVFLVQGRFDAAKMNAGLTKLTGADKTGAWTSKEPGGAMYQLNNLPPIGGFFLAALDNHTIILAANKQHVLDALAKARGRKTTKFTFKEVPGRLKKLRPDVAVQGFGLGSMVVSGQTVSESPNGKVVHRRVLRTLQDSGGREFEVNVTVKDEIHGRFVLTAKDKASLKELSTSFTQVMPILKITIQQQVQANAKFAPLAKFVEGISVRTADGAVLLEGKATVAMIQAVIDVLAMAP